MESVQIESPSSTGQTSTPLFDWHLDVQRLEREAKAALAAGRSDPWAMVEAECSLDLIEAELVALKGRDPRHASDSIVELRSWKARIERVIGTLRSLDDAN